MRVRPAPRTVGAVSDFAWILELYSHPRAAWPAFVAGALAVSLPRGQRWLLLGGVLVSLLGGVLAWQAPDDDGEGFLEISSQMFLTIVTIWWTVTWLPGVVAGWAVRRVIVALTLRGRRRRAARATVRVAQVERPRPGRTFVRRTSGDLPSALAPYGRVRGDEKQRPTTA
jgi:hypothetical protein